MLLHRSILRQIPATGSARGSCRHISSSRSIAYRHIGRAAPLSSTQGFPAASHVRAAQLLAPAALHGVASSRSLSLSSLAFWNYGKKSNDATTQSTAAPAPSAAGTPAPSTATTPSNEAVGPASSLPNTPSTPPELPAATEPDLTAIENIINGQELLNMPEELGYLKALGLDYGWGPTSLMQWIVEHIHVQGGLGWGATLLTMGFLIRAVFFWPHVKQLRYNAKMGKMRLDPRWKEVMGMRQRGLMQGDAALTSQAATMNSLLNKEYGVSPWSMAWAFLPIPFSFGLFRLVKGMSDIPVPGMETAGFAWFTDLTVADPYFILPLISSAVFTGTVLTGMKYAPLEQRAMTKKFIYVLAPVTTIFACFFSAGINLIATSIAGASLLQTLLSNNAPFRRLVGLDTTIPVPVLKTAPPFPATAAASAAAATSPTASTVQQHLQYQAPTSSTTTTAAAATPATAQKPKTLSERIGSAVGDMQKSAQSAMKQGTLGGMMGGGSDPETKAKWKAEQKRKKDIQELERKAAERKRAEWQQKFKR